MDAATSSGFQPFAPVEPTSSSWNSWSGTAARIMGLSFFASMLAADGSVMNSLRLFVLGTIVEFGRRFCQWVITRFSFNYGVTARFKQGDPAYEWILLFLTQQNVWHRSRDFHVTAKSSQRKWGIKYGEDEFDENADFVPMYGRPQLFRWNGYWVETKREREPSNGSNGDISLTIYSLNVRALSLLIAEARRRYAEVSRPNVIIHTLDTVGYTPGMTWSNVKRKARRPLNSIILEDGVLDGLLKDARDFIDTESWYIGAGIPHRRGYLLCGPPGTGKSSTIYALAGELGFEIYVLSLASGFMDDYFLQRAASSIPKHSIFLIEDIDCAFPRREEGEDTLMGVPGYPPLGEPGRRSTVTLSGLLNVLDGVDSEEGRIFFATTNYVERLDAALLRPGRIDVKIEYKLASEYQAATLFNRFFAGAPSGDSIPQPPPDPSLPPCPEKERPLIPPLNDPLQCEAPPLVGALARAFAAQIPSDEFSTAELQGYLLLHKCRPTSAVEGAAAWVARQREERRQKREREVLLKKRVQEFNDKRMQEFNDKRNAALAAHGYSPGGLGMYPPSSFLPPLGVTLGGGLDLRTIGTVGANPVMGVGVGLPGLGGPGLGLGSGPGPDTDDSKEIQQQKQPQPLKVDTAQLATQPFSSPGLNIGPTTPLVTTTTTALTSPTQKSDSGESVLSLRNDSGPASITSETPSLSESPLGLEPEPESGGLGCTDGARAGMMMTRALCGPSYDHDHDHVYASISSPSRSPSSSHPKAAPPDREVLMGKSESEKKGASSSSLPHGTLRDRDWGSNEGESLTRRVSCEGRRNILEASSLRSRKGLGLGGFSDGDRGPSP